MSIAEPETQSAAPSFSPDPGPLHRRLLDTLVNPAGLFARFDETPPWVGAVLVTAVLLVISALLIPADAYLEMAREQMRNMPNQGGQAPDPSASVGMMRVFGILSMLFYPILGAVLVGGLLKLVFGAMLGGEATYQQYLAVYAHTGIIVALGALVTLPIIMATGDMMRQLNFALLVPGAERSGFTFKFLSQFGIFSLWQYAVIAVGVHAVNRGRISTAAAWGGVAALYLVMALIPAIIPTPGQ